MSKDISEHISEHITVELDDTHAQIVKKRFASGTAAKYHFMKCPPQESKYKCDICGETCKDFGNFKLHSKTVQVLRFITW